VNTFSIKDLESISGIKAHTLRIWEQRYNLFKPYRSETNIRSYSNDDLKMLLNVTLLNNNGIKISRIAGMSHEEIYNAVRRITETDFTSATQVDNLIISMVEVDEQRFEQSVSANISQLGFEHTIEQVIYPFLVKVGVLWITDSINPAQEHFITSLIRQKLIAAIDSQACNYSPDAYTALLYLPEGELHEISLLYFHYLLRKAGIRAYYLGQSLPFEDLKKIYALRRPHCMITVLTSGHKVQDYVDALHESFPECLKLLSGYLVVSQEVKTPENTKLFKTPSELLVQLPLPVLHS